MHSGCQEVLTSTPHAGAASDPRVREYALHGWRERRRHVKETEPLVPTSRTLPGVTADAPGRVNLIGEHTDYNGGFVLPAAIPQRTCVELTLRDDDQVVAESEGLGGGTYRLGHERRGGGWLDYAQGLTAVLAAEGHRLTGFEVRVRSEVPIGSGLSSSAALEVALLRALRQAFDLPPDDVQIALLAQRAENDFVGARVGIMDQMAASLADEHTALFLDTRSLVYERVPLPPNGELVVVHSGVVHDHASGDYNTRRAECERAAELLGVAQLRDLDLGDLPRVESLPAPLDRRARHVVTEDARVLEAVDALRAGDARRLGALFLASHASMRDDYAVSVPDVDQLVDLAAADPDVFGARLTGGGFGGSIVALAAAGTARRVARDLTERYARSSGRVATVLVPRPGG